MKQLFEVFMVSTYLHFTARKVPFQPLRGRQTCRITFTGAAPPAAATRLKTSRVRFRAQAPELGLPNPGVIGRISQFLRSGLEVQVRRVRGKGTQIMVDVEARYVGFRQRRQRKFTRRRRWQIVTVEFTVWIPRLIGSDYSAGLGFRLLGRQQLVMERIHISLIQLHGRISKQELTRQTRQRQRRLQTGRCRKTWGAYYTTDLRKGV